MSKALCPVVAIVDYGMGNLFSVKHACESCGMEARMTSCTQTILAADAVILPGVGAFGDAMETLAKLDLVNVLRDVAASGKPLVGICLGMQLLMSESHEFGRHRGLGIIEGEVTRLVESFDGGRKLKVPHIGWNRIYAPARPSEGGHPRWNDSLLEGVPEGAYMYFVHSFYPQPVDARVILSTTRYGSTEFCSSFRRDHVFAFQFHPERSGLQGLQIYHRLALRLKRSTKEGWQPSEAQCSTQEEGR